jgi:hypothetical protein
MVGQFQRARLAEVLPEFGLELRSLLEQSGEHKLAQQMDELEIFDLCRCGDWFCASFYTQPKPKGVYESPHDRIVLEPKEGELFLDVVGGRIAHVEVLYRDGIRDILQSRFP